MISWLRKKLFMVKLRRVPLDAPVIETVNLTSKELTEILDAVFLRISNRDGIVYPHVIAEEMNELLATEKGRRVLLMVATFGFITNLQEEMAFIEVPPQDQLH